MKKITKLILGFSLLIASVSVFAFNMSSRDFGMSDNDSKGEDWGNNSPWKMSSGRWKSDPWGGGPFNMDSREWGAAPWNWGSENNSWGGRNSPWNWNSRDWGNNREPWNRGNRGYGYSNPYYRGPYGGGYNNPYNSGARPYPEMPYFPQAPSSTGVDLERKQ